MQKIITLPKVFLGDKREPKMPSQTTFTNKVKNIIMVPIRAELYLGHLANFLRQHNLQKGFDQKKLGIIFLINDNAADKKNTKVLNENYLTYKYLLFLSQENNAQIELLNLSDEYKSLSKEIIKKNALEIRIDYLHDLLSYGHFGKFRLHLLRLAKTFKNDSLPNKSVIVHFSDVDTTLSLAHYKTLEEKVYNHDYIDSNISQYDFCPGMYEGENKKNIGKEALLYFDAYRFYHCRQQAQLFIKHRLLSGAPTLSSRFSTFYKVSNNRLHPALQKLKEYDTGEDVFIGSYLINKRAGTPLAKRGVKYAEEVYFLYRTRAPQFIEITELTKNIFDAELIYKTIKDKNFKIIDSEEYDISNKEATDTYIDDFEKFFSILNRTPDFMKSREYQDILQHEKKSEQRKVYLRRKLFIKYLYAIQNGSKLNPLEERMITPYLRHFPEEFKNIKEQLLKQGQSPKKIAEEYFMSETFFVFFNFTAPIHTHLARVRALMKYAFIYGTTTREFILPKD